MCGWLVEDQIFIFIWQSSQKTRQFTGSLTVESRKRKMPTCEVGEMEVLKIQEKYTTEK